MIRNLFLALTTTAVLAASVVHAQTTADELPLADDHGAEVYVKYMWSFGSTLITYQDPLVLFPDGPLLTIKEGGNGAWSSLASCLSGTVRTGTCGSGATGGTGQRSRSSVH